MRGLSSRSSISVIVPVHGNASKLQAIMDSIASSSSRVELIIVIDNKELVGKIPPTDSRARVVVSTKIGRGHAFVKGARGARGDIVLLLHSDTVLPSKWDEAILKAMADRRIVGGAFSLSYDVHNRYLELMSQISDLFARLTGEVWGDRAIFVRGEVLGRCLDAMEIPLMEDVRLSRCMRRCGGIVVLKDRVITSADNFRRNGMLGHHWRVLMCRFWYAMGRDPQRLFEYYYS
jgi:glycosyltransferase involved in cell wall biosynthesis